MATGERKLTFLGHILELRRRLIHSVIAVGIGIIIALIFWKWILHVLILPAQNINLIFIELTEMVGVVMKVCLAGGIILAVPYLTLQAVLFIRPALTKKEARYVYLVLPWVALMFIGGVVFGYFVLIPPAIRFLYTFGNDIATPQIIIGNYISIITRLLLAIGLVFELPVLSTLLARLGIIKPEWLASKRKVAVIGAFILAAIITPTYDPVNQTLVAVPLVILYEMSIWLAKLVYRSKQENSSA